MNSRSVTRAPASKAMAMPSPVAIAGFVVSRKTWPAPPVAMSVRPAVDLFELSVATDERPRLDTHRRVSRATSRAHRRRHARAGATAPSARAHDRSRDRCASRAWSTRRTRVRGLTAKRRRSRRIAIERDAPLDELVDVARTVADKHVDRLRHTEAVAGGDACPSA